MALFESGNERAVLSVCECGKAARCTIGLRSHAEVGAVDVRVPPADWAPSTPGPRGAQVCISTSRPGERSRHPGNRFGLLGRRAAATVQSAERASMSSPTELSNLASTDRRSFRCQADADDSRGVIKPRAVGRR